MGAGRPTKYSKERADRFVSAIQLGATYRAASAAAGVSEDTTASWRANIPVFSDRVTEAEQMREIGWLAVIRKAAQKGQWGAATWLLERTNRHYGRNMKIEAEVAGKDGGPITHEIAFDGKLDDATAALAERAIEAIFGGPAK